MSQTSKGRYEASAIIALIAILLTTSVYVPLQTVSAEDCYWYDVYLCDECPCVEDIEIRHLSRNELNKAVSGALRNEDVKTLRAALIKDGYTPKVSDSSSFQIIDEETGELKGLAVVIPFKGEGIYSAIYYLHCYLEDYEIAVAGTSYESGEEVNMNVYKITEEGKVTVTVLHGQSCTFNCLRRCMVSAGYTVIGASGCITACVVCFSGGLPSCIICGICGGVIIGCAIGCCR